MFIEFRPIRVWPEGWQNPIQGGRRNNPFKASYESTLELLEYEAIQLGCQDVLVQLDIQPNQLTAGGGLRAGGATVTGHPGVIVTLDAEEFGTLTYPCDAFEVLWGSSRKSWTVNLRAVALGLEALRKLERYGIAERGQQYAGWKELPSGIPLGAAPMTVEEAARYLIGEGHGAVAVLLLEDPAYTTTLYRRAAKLLHPDNGGDAAKFRRLDDAKRIVDAYQTERRS